MRKAKASAKKRMAVVVGVLLLLIGADYVFYPRFAPPATPPATPLPLPSNGAWLHFDYGAGRATETPAALAARLRENHIRDAYFHVRYIGKSGRLRFDTHQSAQSWNRQMKRVAPDVRRWAWLFIGNERAITGVDISRADVRARIVAACQDLMRGGYDGLQIDYEICPNNDPDFLRLLHEIRAATRDKRLSVATPLWLPVPVGAHGWSREYFTQVAHNCDQVAVMAYDSALYSPRLYVWLMRQQVVQVSRAVAGTGCRVVIGVPTYEEGGLSHDAHTENLANALRGVQEGMRGNPYAHRIEGIANFADYTTDAREWATWRANLR